MLEPLRHRVFAGIWASSSFSHFGSTAQAMAAAWLMASMVNSSVLVAAVQAMIGLPVMLFALVAGALADVMDRRRLMLITQIVSVFLGIALTVFTYLGSITPGLLLLFTFLIAAANAFHLPAWHSSVGEQVPRELLPAAISLNAVGLNLARSVAPAVAGLILALAGAAMIFLLNTLSFIAVIAALLAWRRTVPKQMLPPEALHHMVAGGIRFVALSPKIRVLLTRAFIFGVGAASVWSLMPLVVINLLRGGPFVYGILLGSFGVGALLGGLINGPLRSRFHPNRITITASIAIGCMTIVVATSGTLLLIIPALIVTGAAWLLSFTNFNITVQMGTSRWIVGRVLSIYQMTIYAGLAGGSLLWGVCADAFGLTNALLLSGGWLIGSAILARWLSLPVSSAEESEPSHPDPAASDLVPPLDQGRIVVTIEYRVEAANASAFLNEMRTLAHHRKLEGARGWTLTRDISDPDLWTEIYSSRDWNDHLRRRSRRTKAGQAARERVAALVPRDTWHIRLSVEQRPDQETNVVSGFAP